MKEGEGGLNGKNEARAKPATRGSLRNPLIAKDNRRCALLLAAPSDKFVAAGDIRARNRDIGSSHKAHKRAAGDNERALRFARI